MILSDESRSEARATAQGVLLSSVGPETKVDPRVIAKLAALGAALHEGIDDGIRQTAMAIGFPPDLLVKEAEKARAATRS